MWQRGTWHPDAALRRSLRDEMTYKTQANYKHHATEVKIISGA
jgi:hypothetical protein